MRWQRLSIALAFVAAGSGCGDDELSATPDPDAAAVSEAFIESVAAGDSRACDSLTPEAAHLVGTLGGAPSCEQAIEAQTKYVEAAFYGPSPSELTEGLETGHLKLTDTGVEYRFCTPTGIRVVLELVESEDRWTIDAVTGFEKTVGGKVAPCHDETRR